MLFRAVPFDSHRIPFFSSKIVKSFIFTASGVAPLRSGFSGGVYTDVSLTPLVRGGRPVYCGDSVSAGDDLWFRVSIVSSDSSGFDWIQSVDEVVEFSGHKWRVWLDRVDIVERDGLALDLSVDRELIKISFISPALIPTKYMSPQ
ncbi:MAG: hypothetical protein RMI45_08005 [Ignisphaera sp.]|nr:hypothetical protein [Ignisphaera sp.]MDW8086159.1 hypothetical protein [Ignisphaera sp.]